MKSLLLIPLILLSTLPVHARHQQSGYSNQCFRNVYREQYHPGTQQRPGYVRRWTERKEVPCWNAGAEEVRPQPYPQSEQHYDDNSCIEGAILGGLAGGGLGAALSRNEGMIYGIPLGIVGGALVGCQIDGG